jgi:thiamine monophosphate synthase
VFAIGGIDPTNASALVEVGRIAVGSAILCASDPGRAARELRALIERT